MTRPASLSWSAALCAIVLASCSEDMQPVAPPPVTPIDADNPDRQVLVTLYNATGGTGWSQRRNWNTPSSIGTWYGVTTNSAGFVTELELDDNGLSGSLPAQLGNLAQLKRLVLDGNEISGRIPPELGNLSNLTMLNLRGNNLEGSIPSELGALAMLDTLDLFNSGLSGSIPPALGNLVSVQRFTVGWNDLTGAIPAELGRLDNATYMNFSRNELTGTIPPELGDLDSIELLSVSRNNLTGTIPTELGQLATLERLYLYDNQLTGELPPVLGQLSQLDLLWIHQNRLTGPIPDEFANLTAMDHLRAYENGLSGPIPPFLGGFPLRILYLHENAFSGGIPAEIGEISTLQYLSLDENRDLAGLLPRSLLAIERLERLTFEDTGLCPQVDTEFQDWLQGVPNRSEVECDIGQVERLALSEFHELTDGTSWKNGAAWRSDADVGDWYGVISEGGRVVDLSLPDNGLAGPLPAEIANLGELRVVDLSDNDLSGAFPGAIGGLSELTELRVGRNMGLEGALPFGLRRLDQLRVLDFDETGLCASPSANFQAWLAAIAETAGAICDNPEEVTVSLSMVYLTQSVQTPEREVRLVANRDALLRAFVTADEPRGYFEPEVVAVFTVLGEEVHRVVMTRDDNQIPAEVDEGDLKLSYNAVIPADNVVPGLQMFVEVDPEGTLPLTDESRTRFPPLATEQLDVVEVRPMQLTLVPVLPEAAPDTSILAWVRGVSADSPQVGLLKHSFPFAEFSVSPHEAFYTSLDITTTAGQVALFGELEALRTAEGGNGYYYGVAADLGSVGGRGQLPGWVSIGVRSANTLAHEVGHNLSLRHAPCGGPEGIDPAFPYRDGSIGVWGYDFRNGSTVSPDRGTDIMTYCRATPWISDYHYEKAIDHRAGLAGDVASPRIAAGHVAASDVLVVWGGVADGEVQLEPVYSMQAASRLPETGGPYRIRGIGSDGRTLLALDFTPVEDGHGGKHFFFLVPLEPDWDESLERIILSGPEGQVAVDREDDRAITLVTEHGTGRIRAILRDWESGLPAGLRGVEGLEIKTTRGLGDAVRLGR